MLTTVIAILSGALVAFGIMALVRDRMRRERQKLIAARKQKQYGAGDFADVVIKVETGTRPELPTARLSDPPPVAEVVIVEAHDPSRPVAENMSPAASRLPPSAPRAHDDPLGNLSTVSPAAPTQPAPLPPSHRPAIDYTVGLSDASRSATRISQGSTEPVDDAAYGSRVPMNGPSDSSAAKADEESPGEAGQGSRAAPSGEPAGHDKSLPELPSVSIADVPRLAPAEQPVHTARAGIASSAASGPSAPPQSTATATQPTGAAATEFPAPPKPTPAIPIPQLRRLDGLTIGALPTRKPLPQSAQATTTPSAPGGLSFGSVDDRPAPPPHERAAAQFGTPLMPEPPLPAAKRPPLPQSPATSSNALDDLVRTIGTLTEDRAAPGIDQPRSQRVELDFYAILPEVVSAIEDVRQPLERIGIEIGPQGQPTWSARNAAYGTLQRIEMSGSVLAWLICEMEHRGALVVRVVPERADDVAITGTARRERGPFQRPDIANAAAEALKPLASYAAVVVPRRGQALNAAQVAQEAQWAEIEPVAREALVAANEALTSVAAQLEPMAHAAFDNASMRMRWPVTVEVGGAIVALMHVERSDDWLDVAITPSDSHRADLVRRARTVATGVTPQSLAEVMAEAVWPVIVAARSGATSQT